MTTEFKNIVLKWWDGESENKVYLSVDKDAPRDIIVQTINEALACSENEVEEFITRLQDKGFAVKDCVFEEYDF